MGRLLLISRLAVKDLRHRPAQAMLLLLAIAAGTATLTLGLSVHGATNNPYARTRAATSGPDVVATFSPPVGGPGPATTARPGETSGTAANDRPGAAAPPLASAAGVIAHSGPFPVTWGLFRAAGYGPAAWRSRAETSLPRRRQPRFLLPGSWVRPGGVVVEAGFASALGLYLGDLLSMGGTAFRVVGVAVTAAIPAYPNPCGEAEGCFLANGVASHNPGLVWATGADMPPRRDLRP